MMCFTRPALLLLLVLVLIPATVSARDYKTPFLPLVQPQIIMLADHYENGFDLTLDVLEYDGPGAKFWTRGYNGEIPGPTLVMKRGTTPKVNLINALQTPSIKSGVNTFSRPNNTNIHTHGLHVPHEEPGDDVFINVPPQSTYNYAYEIPEDHVGGTYWYHPHLHGSTALQVGGGAHGLIIVEDDPSKDGLPAKLTDGSIEEIVLVISVIPQQSDDDASLHAIEAASSPASSNTVTTTAGPSTLVLVNGQNKPTITLTAAKWYRLRTVLASVLHFGNFFVDGCELAVLAKDGVYLLSGPRATEFLFLVSGNRVDALIKCPSALVGNDSVVLESKSGAGIQGDEDDDGATNIGNTIIAKINVVAGDDGSDDPPLSTLDFIPNLPSYLRDLRSVSVHGRKEIGIDDGPGGCNINGNSWDGPGNPMFSVYASTYEDIAVEADEHPLHVHINPWYRSGDWHDVVLANGNFRMHVADHKGTVVTHCHWLNHEDRGCMGTFEILDCPEDDIAAGNVGNCSTFIYFGFTLTQIGFMVGGVVVVVLVAGVVFCFFKKKKKEKTFIGIGGESNDEDDCEMT